MKKLLVILYLPIILTACSSDAPETDGSAANKTQYTTSNFSIMAPQDWQTIAPTDFTTNFPTETQVAFRSNIKNEIYTANVNVTMRQIGKTTTTDDFAKSMLANAKKSLLGYEELGTREQIIAFGEEELQGLIYEFQGKKSTVEPIVNFRELYVAHDSLGFTVTTSYLPNDDENVVNLANEMLDSFSLK